MQAYLVLHFVCSIKMATSTLRQGKDLGFFLEFFIPYKNFSLIWSVTVTCAFLSTYPLPVNYTYARHSWLLSSEGPSRATPTLTRSIRLKWSYPRISGTHTYCRVFGSGTVSTCFYGLGLLRLEFEHPAFRLRGGCSN